MKKPELFLPISQLTVEFSYSHPVYILKLFKLVCVKKVLNI